MWGSLSLCLAGKIQNPEIPSFHINMICAGYRFGGFALRPSAEHRNRLRVARVPLDKWMICAPAAGEGNAT